MPIQPKKKSKPSLKVNQIVPGGAEVHNRVVRGRAFADSNTGRRYERETAGLQRALRFAKERKQYYSTVNPHMQFLNMWNHRVTHVNDRILHLQDYKRNYVNAQVIAPYPQVPANLHWAEGIL